MTPKKITVLGSFRRHYNEISEDIKTFNDLGIEVLSPKISKIINPGEEFAILKSDKGSPKELEDRHLSQILLSDCVYVCNPEGYIGITVAFEIGYALSQQIPILFKVKPQDFTMSLYCDGTYTPQDVASFSKVLKR